jgi:hypothetical protein
MNYAVPEPNAENANVIEYDSHETLAALVAEMNAYSALLELHINRVTSAMDATTDALRVHNAVTDKAISTIIYKQTRPWHIAVSMLVAYIVVRTLFFA